MKPFTEGSDPDVVFESHITGWSAMSMAFRFGCFETDKSPKRFKSTTSLAVQLDDYPVLDESDYSNREYEATVENIDIAAWKLKQQFELPEGWAHSVYDWLSQHMETEIENVDDQGGWPSKKHWLQHFWRWDLFVNNSHVAKP